MSMHHANPDAKGQPLLPLRDSSSLPCTFAKCKGFAVCRTRQSPLGNQSYGKALFANCFLSGTLQTFAVCEKTKKEHSAICK
jgi:hypothetical protein